MGSRFFFKDQTLLLRSLVLLSYFILSFSASIHTNNAGFSPHRPLHSALKRAEEACPFFLKTFSLPSEEKIGNFNPLRRFDTFTVLSF